MKHFTSERDMLKHSFDDKYGLESEICPVDQHSCRAAKRRQYVVDEWVDAFDVPMPERPSKSQLPSWSNWHWKDLGERIAYKYFCWRYAV